MVQPREQRWGRQRDEEPPSSGGADVVGVVAQVSARAPGAWARLSSSVADSGTDVDVE